MIKHFIIILFLVASINSLKAQDAHFSQFYFNRLYLNPSLAGADNGVRGSLQYRQQWLGIPGQMSTYSFGIDGGIPRIGSGCGLLAMQSVQGQGYFTTTRVAAMYSKLVGLIDKQQEKLILYFGLSGGFIQQGVDMSKLTFSDQYDPVLGKIYSTSAVTESGSRLRPDFGAGLTVRYKKNSFYHSGGVAFDHLNRPDLSLLESGVKLQMKATINYQANIRLSHREAAHIVYIGPGAIFQMQGEFKTLNFGSMVTYGHIFGGLWYRSKNFNVSEGKTDAMIINLGYKDKLTTDWLYTVGYSFDATVSGLTGRTSGTHEIVLIFEYNPIVRRQRTKTKHCRDFKAPSDISLPIF